MNPQPLLTRISANLKHLLGGNLVGVYIHGSIAFGCFNWQSSDIDFIVVAESPIDSQTKRQILQMLDGMRPEFPPKGLEVSIVLHKHCKTFTYPAPYEFHYSNDYIDDCSDSFKTDYDLAAHFTVIKSAGITLCGNPIAGIFGDVPKADYLDSIGKDIENAVEDVEKNPVYIILNLCRVCAYIQDGLVLSKKSGGQWGLANLPHIYHGLISAILESYESGDAAANDPMQISFCKYMTALIIAQNGSKINSAQIL